MNAPLISDPGFCLQHAEEVRALADLSDDEVTRDRLRSIASGYEAMAVRAHPRQAARTSTRTSTD